MASISNQLRLSLRNHQWAVLLLGLFLAGLIGYMMVSNYRSQTALRESAINQIKLELGRQSATIGFFFADRLQDLKDLDSRKELHSFFENRDLGMTMAYGLRASLFEIYQIFKKLQEDRQIGGELIYSRLAFIDDQEQCLVDTQSGILPPRQLSDVDENPFYTPNAPEILFNPHQSSLNVTIVTPLFFKSRLVGQIKSWVSLSRISHQLIKQASDGPSQEHFLYADYQVLSAPFSFMDNIPFSAISEIDLMVRNQHKFFDITFLDAHRHEGMIFGSIVPNTPFYLLRIMPRKEVIDSMKPWQLMVLLTSLTVLVIGGLLAFWFQSSKSLALQIHLEESASREAVIAEKNQQLEIEIVQKKLFEESLVKSEKKYRDLFDNIKDFIYTYDMQGRFLTINPAVAQLLEYKPVEMIGRSVVDFMPSKYRANFFNHYLPEIISTGSNHGITQFIGKNGQIHHIEYTNSVVFENSQAVYIRGSGHDITGFKRAEALLQESQEHLQTILDSLRSGIVIIDLETRHIVDANSYTLEKLGKTQDEIKDQSCSRFFSCSNGNMCPFIGCDGCSLSFEGLLTNAQGEQIPIMKTVVTIRRDEKDFLLESFLDISESKENEKELLRLKEQAEATSRELAQSNDELNQAIEMANQMVLTTEVATAAKSNFLANMSHEIRTPLNAIIGMAELLAETDLTPKQREYLSIFQSSGENLLHLINDILDMSKIESGHLRLEDLDFNLNNLMMDIGAILEVQGSRKGLSTGCAIDPEIPVKLRGDPSRLRQVLMNLMGNALKFTKQGSITISVRRLIERKRETNSTPSKLLTLEFSVQDTGVGIPENKLQTIFDAFTQVDPSITRKFGGTGLGLSISKKLVELMGGTLSATSEMGKGSIFRFSTTMQSTESMIPPMDAPVPESLQVVLKITDSPASISPDKIEALPFRRILIAEDIENNRILIQEFLMQTGWQLTFAENGQEAVKFYQKDHYDLILMDMQMPVMDGYTATKTIRKQESHHSRPRIPIIALTGNAFTEDVEKCLAVGCNEHLSKPIRKQILLTTILRFLALTDKSELSPVPVQTPCLMETAGLEEPEKPAEPKNLEEPTPPVENEGGLTDPFVVVVDPDLESLIPDFLQSIRDQLPQLFELLAADNYVEIKKIGHSLKGVGGGYGFQKITEFGARIEQAAGAQAHADIALGLTGLKDYLARVQFTSSASFSDFQTF
jgi:PAS domain S-box-containing protein